MVNWLERAQIAFRKAQPTPLPLLTIEPPLACCPRRESPLRYRRRSNRGSSPLIDPVQGLPHTAKIQPATVVCFACQGCRLWVSIYGATICGRCHPPAASNLVSRWLDFSEASS